jgi:hypothetical protein
MVAAVIPLHIMVHKKEFIYGNHKIDLLALTALHIQLLIGLVLYFVSSLVFASLAQMANKEL